MLDGLTVIDINGKQATRYEHLCGINPAVGTKLRSLGESVVVKTISWSNPKISERGKVCMMVGHKYNSG